MDSGLISGTSLCIMYVETTGREIHGIKITQSARLAGWLAGWLGWSCAMIMPVYCALFGTLPVIRISIYPNMHFDLGRLRIWILVFFCSKYRDWDLIQFITDSGSTILFSACIPSLFNHLFQEKSFQKCKQNGSPTHWILGKSTLWIKVKEENS